MMTFFVLIAFGKDGIIHMYDKNRKVLCNRPNSCLEVGAVVLQLAPNLKVSMTLTYHPHVPVSEWPGARVAENLQ